MHIHIKKSVVINPNIKMFGSSSSNNNNYTGNDGANIGTNTTNTNGGGLGW